MRIILNDNINPFFNIASEEYLLREFTENCFMLYRNRPSVIVGKHQNTLAEINYEFLKKNGIDLVRRLSGGGTVYHDLGNINFTYVLNGEEGKMVDFRRFTQPIISLLSAFNIKAYFGGNNDIRVDGLKISGNAEHVYKKRILHHGTMLYSSNLTQLNEVLKAKEGLYRDKAVKSVRSEVMNLEPLIPGSYDIHAFMKAMYNQIKNEYHDAYHYRFSNADISRINRLINEKYRRWEWNFGYSPDYSINNHCYVHENKHQIYTEVNKGLIVAFAVHGILASTPEMNAFKEKVINKLHKEETIMKCAYESGLHKILEKKELLQLADSMFQ